MSDAASREPSFMIEPLPKARSIWPSAASKARCLSIMSLSNRRNAVCMIPLLRYFTAGQGAQRATRFLLYMICSPMQYPLFVPLMERPAAASGNIDRLDSRRESPMLKAPCPSSCAAEPPMFIQTEQTPNPATLKFLPGCTVMETGTANFPERGGAARSPLAERLFELPEVTGVFLGTDFITVTKNGDSEWHQLKPAVLAAIMEHFTAGRPVIIGDAIAAAGDATDEDSEI